MSAEPLDGRFRSLGIQPGLSVADVGAQSWNLARGDLPLPALALLEPALASNLELVHGWCAEQGVSIAPHGKTTLAPELIRRQLAAGSWGMTAATVHQVGVMAEAGARRVILANELAGAEEMHWLEALRHDRELETWVFVDSVAGVQLLASAPRERALPVLLEVGDPGGRAGCRDEASAFAVAEAVAASETLLLAGVAAWEGGLGGDRSEATLGRVDALLARTRTLAASLDAQQRFETDEIILTAGGSAFVDRVVSAWRGTELSRPVRTIVRSGCYLTHDHGFYTELSPFRDALQPAIQLWAQVLSCPEPGLAIAGFGKRDAPYDLGLPIVLETVRDGQRQPAAGITVTTVNDQHAFLAHDGGLAVGDLVVCGISHPCTAFDKWSLVLLVDADATVTGAVRTHF